MQYTTVNHVRVISARDASTGALVASSVLAEKLDLLLCSVPGLLNLLRALLRAARELLGLVLDLLVKTLEDREDRALDGLFGLDVGVDNSLGVNANVFEEAGDTAKGLVEVVALLERLRDGLEEISGLDSR